MGYAVLADIVVVVHFAFVVFVVLGGFLAWRWPKVMWLHLPCVGWSAALVLAGLTCPLTPLERSLREQAGQGTMSEGFVERYLEGVVYPGEHTATARALAVVAIAVSWAGVGWRWWRRRHEPTTATRRESALQ